MTHKFNYNWTLKDTAFTKDKGKVFSCFAGGGGGSMGYELAGFDVIGCNEVDPKLMACYIVNLKPKYIYAEPIQQFKLNGFFPEELYELDILDGSVPCSSFTFCGDRSEGWGKKKKFREGQFLQILDRLVFDLIDVAEILRPKVVVIENVKGMLAGGAKKYVIEMREAFASAGYVLQHWVLDSSKMGVPQKRERVFFIALRADIAAQFSEQKNMFDFLPKLDLNFNEQPILYSSIAENGGKELTTTQRLLWNKRMSEDRNLADINFREHGKRSNFNTRLIRKNEVLPTVVGEASLIEYDEPKHIALSSIIKAQSFPTDYDFLGGSTRVEYVCGISVPPVMMAHVSSCIYEQWLSKIK
jgi:DNA (cytosine-5)-methyltransferase 1